MSKTGFPEFSAQLGKICRELEDAEGLKKATQFVRSAAVLNAPASSGYLRDNIFADVEVGGQVASGIVYTNVSYAPYVELGTGPRGAADHDGISPEVSPTYTMEPWWIHESDLDVGVAEMYRWPYIDTPDGRFYKCSGQPAYPFMYPALKDNEDEVIKILDNDIEKVLKKVTK